MEFNAYRAENKYKGMKEEDLWIMAYCGLIIERKIMEACGRPCPLDRFSHTRICNDRRRSNTVKKAITDAGFIVKGTWEPLMDAVLAYVKYTKTEIPEFKLRLTHTSSYRESSTPVTSLYATYKDVIDLEPREIFYVYKHLNLYDIVAIDTEKVYNTHGYKIDFKVKLFPKKDIPAAEQELFKATLDHFCRTHVNEMVEGTFGISAKNLAADEERFKIHGSQMVSPLGDWAFFPPTEEQKQNENEVRQLSDRIRVTIRQIKRLYGTLSELRLLRRATRGMNEEQLIQRYQEKMPAYLLTMAPLYVMDETDAGKRRIATMLLKQIGTDERSPS